MYVDELGSVQFNVQLHSSPVALHGTEHAPCCSLVHGSIGSNIPEASLTLPVPGRHSHTSTLPVAEELLMGQARHTVIVSGLPGGR